MSRSELIALAITLDEAEDGMEESDDNRQGFLRALMEFVTALTITTEDHSADYRQEIWDEIKNARAKRMESDR